jgi:DNA-binding NarL/FixJ family response regulator
LEAARERQREETVANSNGAPPILIADPDRVARRRTASVLQRAGHTTIEADDGEQALEVSGRSHPCAVILEVSLPGVCGYEVCRQLRETFGDDLPIVFVSGARKESFDRVGGLLLGADDYVVKPFVGDELVARIRRLLRHHNAPESRVASSLTTREREVLGLLAEGMDQKEIARSLSISPKTVGTHTEHIFVKLGVRSRTQAAALAYRNDLVQATS